MAHLTPGQRLRGAASGVEVKVVALLGEGGQGEVYEVALDGRRFAMKWYNDQVLRVDRGLRERLACAIDRGAPSARFLWPFELVTLPDGSRLGYLMRLRHARFEPLSALLDGTLQPSFRVLATLCCLLTDSLYALHAKGLVYQDLNGGNVFFDPASGEIEICDNDNVDTDGAASVMGGVWEFQAPEVAMREAGPSRATDLHSLAVMLFRILHLGHPLVGRREMAFANLADPAALRSLYGRDACFVFDPDDASNRPLPERHGPVLAHWQIYPQALRELFTRAFTEGLRDAQHGRVQETQWRRAMSQLRDAVLACPDCAAENFYDGRRLSAGQGSFPCWHCTRPLKSAPPRLGLRRLGARPGEAPAQIVLLQPGARLYAHHTEQAEIDFSRPTAEVTPEADALRNLGSRPWHAERAGETIEIGPRQALPLHAGWRIRFERAEGEVKV